MTTTTDLTDLIAAYRKTLAEATKECPGCGDDYQKSDDLCDGTGRTPRFPGFRQVCPDCPCRPLSPERLALWAGCRGCNGTGWQVRAGGLEDGLAGLTREQTYTVFVKLRVALMGDDEDWYSQNPMPSAPEILAEGLRLVIGGAWCQVEESDAT